MSLIMAPLSKFAEINSESINNSYSHDEIEYTDISSIGSGYITEAPKLLALKESPSRAKRIVRHGDTILATVRPNLRSFLFIKNPADNAIVSTGFAVLRAKKNVEPRYVYYAVTDFRFTQYLTNNTKGTSYPAVDSDTVLRGEIPDHGFLTQRRIASILSAYDDLIENNRRRIQLLEQAARLLYKEWFVRLRFPGHEHTKIINGIPAGWEKGCVGNLASVKSGFAFKSKDWQQDGNPVIKIKNIVGDGTIDTINCDCVSDNVAETASDFEIPTGTLLIAMTGATVGKVGIMPDSLKKYFLNQRVGIFKAESDYPIERLFYPFFQGGFAQTQVQNLAGGAAQPNISGGQIESIELLIPDNKILMLYLETTEAIFLQRQNILNQNIKLAEARDLLLPRLMNGEIAV